eukprot:IDg10969t1
MCIVQRFSTPGSHRLYQLSSRVYIATETLDSSYAMRASQWLQIPENGINDPLLQNTRDTNLTFLYNTQIHLGNFWWARISGHVVTSKPIKVMLRRLLLTQREIIFKIVPRKEAAVVGFVEVHVSTGPVTPRKQSG